MGLLSRSVGIKALSLEDPSQPLLPFSVLSENLGLGRSDAGVLVNAHQALRLGPVFAVWKIISEDLSKIPLSVFQRLPDDSIRLAREQRTHSLIHDQPNDRMTAVTFRGALITSALAFGNGYAFIQRDGSARAVALHLIPSERTSAVILKDGTFGFMTTATVDGAPKWMDKENVLHLVGLTMDGITGFSPVTTCKNAVGIGLAAEKFSAQFFGNGSRATGVLSHPAHLDAEAYENLKKSVREWATGENALRPIILEEGLKWEQITVNPNEGQLVESRKFQVEEVARLYRVPLHKLGELSRSTMNNIEHQGIEHIQDALQPWAAKLEAEINVKLLSGNYFAEHDFSELQRGDSVALANSIGAVRNIGLLNTNDGLKKLRMNPISEAEGGNVRIVQGAFINLKALVAPGPTEPLSQQDADAAGDLPSDPNAEHRRQIFASYRRLFRDAVGRSIHRSGDSMFVYRALQPILAAMREAANAASLRPSELNQADEGLVTELATSMAKAAPEWSREEASAIADRLTEEAINALAHT